MPYDPTIIAALTDEEYASLMVEAWNLPLPRRVVRCVEVRELSRKERIEAMLATGVSRKEAAARLNLSVCMISLILSGKRN